MYTGMGWWPIGMVLALLGSSAVAESDGPVGSQTKSLTTAQRAAITVVLGADEPIPVTLSLRAPPSTAAAGVPYTLTADLLVSTGNPDGLPVLFDDGAGGSCTGLVQDLVASCSLTSTFGDRLVTAKFPAPGSFGYSDDQATLRVRNAQSVGFVAPPTPIGFLPNKSFPLSATASSGLPVSFSSLTPSVCSVVGTAATVQAAGLCRLAADQPGNTDFVPAVQVVREVVVDKAQQFLQFSLDNSYAVGSHGITATSRYFEPDGNGNPLLTGLPPSFSTQTPSTCTVAGSTLTVLTAGLCTIVANQPGDANHQAAAPVPSSTNSGKANQSISFVAPPSPSFVPGGSFSVTASASSGLPVSFSAGPGTICSVGAGTGTAPVSILGAGDCVVIAAQAGNDVTNAAPNEVRTVTIRRAQQDLLIDDPGAQYFGLGRVFEASARSVLRGTSTPTGLPVGFATSGQICQAIGGSEIRIVQESGTCTLVAFQQGNANFEAVVVQQSNFVRDVSVALSTTATSPTPAASEQAASDDAGRYLIYTVGGSAGEVWRLDSRTGRRERVDLDDLGQPVGTAGEPSVSGNGTLALFTAPNAAVKALQGESKSQAAARHAKGGLGAFLRSIQTGRTIGVSSAAGTGGTPRIAADGASVVFTGTSPLSGGKPAVFSRRIEFGVGGAITLAPEVCQTCAADPAETPLFDPPALSGNGQWLTFASDSKTLLAGGTACSQATRQLFLRNIQTGATRQIGAPTAGNCLAGNTGKPSIDQSGRFVVFQSDLPLLGGVAPGENHVYLHDTLGNTTRRLSETAVIDTPPSISGDGRTVAFVGGDGDLRVAALDTAGAPVGTLRRLGPAQTGQQVAGSIRRPLLDRFGKKLMFDSDGGNLVTNAPNGQRRVFQMAVPAEGFEANFQRVFASSFE